MIARDKIYFASDIHLGALGYESSRDREDRFVRWLDSIKHDAAELFLIGDVFDFWFEYKTVVPRGYIRFLGKLAEITDSGVKLYLFKGNHDMWMFDYFVKELNATIISNELIIERQGKKLYLHHGDGLGPGDNKYKLLKKVFRSSTCQWLFERLHPNLGVGIANWWSQHSRISNATGRERKLFENEWLVSFARQVLQTEHYDYFVFGHRHIPMVVELSKGSQYVNLGEWVFNNSYAVMDAGIIHLQYFEQAAVITPV
jgi:UDP-2,3-diacylglucosamine hydrolase